MFIIVLLCFVCAIYAYVKKENALLLTMLSFFMTNGYMFIPSESFIIKANDYTLAIILFITLRELSMNSSYFKTQGDLVAKLIITLLCYQTFEFLYTIITDAESPLYAFKLFRFNIIYLIYFYLRKIKYEDYQKFISINLKLCIVQGIFFYLQPIGITGVLNGRVDEAIYSSQLVRYANYPFWAQFYFIYGFFCRKSFIKKAVMVCFFGGMFLLGMSRGIILMSAAAIISYVLLMHKAKYYTMLLIGLIIGYMVVLPIFKYRDSEGASSKSSTIDDILNVVTSNNLSNIENDGGTFTFRIAMLVERWNYLTENPQYLLTGVGLIHEQSPKCYNRFYFILGTKNDGFKHGRCMLESGDITWVPLLIRYGILGIIIYALILSIWIKQSITDYVYMKNPICIATSLMSISITVGSMSNMVFDSYINLFIVIFCMTAPCTFKHYLRIFKNNKIIQKHHLYR